MQIDVVPRRLSEPSHRVQQVLAVIAALCRLGKPPAEVSLNENLVASTTRSHAALGLIESAFGELDAAALTNVNSAACHAPSRLRLPFDLPPDQPGPARCRSDFR